jgi:ribosomal protein S12 methylthiotransferase
MNSEQKAPLQSTVALCNLGCSKNQVDGETMMGWFELAGFTIVEDFELADIILVNTCAFIKEAKQEAIDTVFDAVGYRKNGHCGKLIVCGCFSERYRATAAKEFPEVDHWVGVHAWRGEFEKIFAQRPPHGVRRHITGSAHSQYLKIAEGCSHRCSFCVIPSIRGPFKSRAYEPLRDEALWLYEKGVRECILVSQDTTSYGRDSGSSLTRLVERLLADTAFPWIRMMYLHPSLVDRSLLDLVAHEPRLCPYFDIPLQHIADPILTAMHRAPLSAGIYRLLDTIRNSVPDCAIRTSLIVGFPGETPALFKELVTLLETARFEKVGIFPFSPEEGTSAVGLRPRPSDQTVAKRCEELMEVQRSISAGIGTARIGRTLKVFIDGVSDEPGFELEGRTQWDAPEIDGRVLIRNTAAQPGEIIDVRISEAGDYDLYG